MYGNADAALLWLIQIATYLINECNLKRIKTNSYILFKKDDDGKLELVMYIYVDNVFMAGKTDTLEKN